MNVELHQRFVTNVKRRRLTLGMTQHQIADRLDIKQPSYAAIEAGRCNPSLDVVEKVARALDCDPEELLAPISFEKISA
jgi:transcriptional regulator with XRE-family HTH domain